jgi:3-oxoadipyl-CoA thiolase
MRDAFIVDAVRTPIGRYGGALAHVRPDDLAAIAIKSLMKRTGAPLGLIDDVLFGCANQAGEDNRNVARMALLLAGLPVQVPGATVNRLCGSGLMAVADAARLVQCGDADLVIAGGVESMSRAPMVMPKADSPFARGNVTMYDSTLGWRFENPQMQRLYGCDSLGETAEKVADLHKVTRDAQDAFALQSQQAWAAADAANRFADELIPVTVSDGKTTVIVSRDEHPRPDVTAAELARLRPIFRANGTITAGNCSGLNDGAAAILVASEAGLKKLTGSRSSSMVRAVASAVVGVEPSLMGLGPIPAVKRALQKSSLSVSNIDLVEINEAFAAQAVPCVAELGIDRSVVNVNGGAIAIGHPLGCSGARMTATLIHELSRRKGRYAMATMCIGVGQGIAMVFERT